MRSTRSIWFDVLEFGSPRTRLRTQANLDHVTLTWIFTAAEMGDFHTW